MYNAKTILIVDDGEGDRLLCRRYIDCDPENRYRILEAATLKQGLELWRSQKPDATLIDLSLTDGNGLALVETIRDDICSNTSERVLDIKLPVIVLTGSEDAGNAVSAMHLGTYDYLLKNDITEYSLQQCIRSLLEHFALVRQLEQSRKREELVSQMSLNIHQFIDLKDICQFAVQEISKFLQTDRTLIYKFYEDSSRKIVAEEVVPTFSSCLKFGSDNRCDHLSEEQLTVYLDGKAIANADIHSAGFTECHVQMLEGFQVQSNVIVPILLAEPLTNSLASNKQPNNQTLWGLLIVHQCSATRDWEEHEIKLLQQLSVQLAIAIQQAEVYQNLQDLNSSLALQVQDQTSALQASEHKLRSILNGIPDIINLISIDGTYLESKRDKSSYDLIPNHVDSIGKNIVELLPADLAKSHIQAIRQAVSSGEMQTIDQTYQTSKGLHYEEVRVVPIDDNAAVVIVRDNSDRRRAEELFRASEEKIQKIALSSPAIIKIFVQRANGSTYFEYLSLAYEEIRELKVAQVMQNPQLSFEQIHPDDIANYWEAVGLSLETLSTLQHEWRIVTPSGNHKWLRADLRPDRRENGDTAWYGTVSDISDRKKMEIALAQAKELAETANIAKSEFLANMSHEIRTPMNGVLGMAQLLAATPLRDDQKDFVKIILDSGDALLTVINDILDFSKIESGNLQLEQKEFNIEDTINAVCNLLNKQASDKNINLQCHVNSISPTTVVGDSSRLRQILLNLIGNAIKFTEQGYISISYNRKLITANTYEFNFAIADTGIGIDCDRIDKLFKPFTQADASINRQFGGTGLGLAISMRLVELMGGTIWMESRGAVGGKPPSDWVIRSSANTQGSTFHFTITLPVMATISKVESIDKLGSALSNTNKISFEQFPLKILIVEDNMINQKIIVLMLQKLGCQADVVVNGRECVAVITDQEPNPVYDLIFMDVQMPVMDGLTATRTIRQSLSSPTQPWIIALTADALPEDYAACFGAGMNDFVGKPINIKVLERSLLKYIKDNNVRSR
jgi:signal transduction histidine kinase/PleD family two-component response regulator